MKLIIIILILLFILGMIFMFTRNSQTVQNIKGTAMGYGGCPNCGDSWYNTPYESITYSMTLIDGPLLYPMYGVMICKKCLSNPQSLSSDRMGAKLLSYGWESNKVELVKKAVKQYQNNPAEWKLKEKEMWDMQWKSMLDLMESRTHPAHTTPGKADE